MASKKSKNILAMNESTLSTVMGALVVIIVGFLIFNYFRQAQPTQEITQESATDQQQEIVLEEKDGQQVPVGLPTKHTVSSQEDLWKIAEKYYGSGYNWVDIVSENGIVNPDVITEGQELTIPQVAVRRPVEEPALAQVAGEEAKGGVSTVPETYTVQAGDTLWGIAVRIYADGYRWPEISQANSLANPDLIEVGQQLTLPK